MRSYSRISAATFGLALLLLSVWVGLWVHGQVYKTPEFKVLPLGLSLLLAVVGLLILLSSIFRPKNTKPPR